MSTPGDALPPFVTAAQVRALAPPPALVDVRWYLDGRSGLDAYRAGHLPGAVFVDLDTTLAAAVGDGSGGRHPLPDPAVFTAGLAAAGVGGEDPVVAYDDAGGTVAARLVWLLRATGRRAAVLDGGLQAWDGPLETGTATRPRTAPEVRDWPPGLLADADDALAPGTVLLDARAPERYRGEVEPVDPRAGHVPGAVNLPAAHALAGGRLVGSAELRRAFEQAGAGADAYVVASCGSGVTACFTLLVREHAGLPPGRLWPGSFSQWSRDPTREVVTGPAPHR